MSTLYMLWDEAHIWGLLAWRALVAMGLPHRVVRAEEIAQGALAGKPAVLVVPGGVARRKAQILGQAGLAAIRDYVASGGVYMGFCGGSGLGLTGEYGLGLCPWHRAAIRDRLLHLVSGHIHVQTDPDSELTPDFSSPDDSFLPLVPVWWPARFEQEPGDAVRVLARYAHPGPDFWLADLPMANLPSDAFSQWEDSFGVRFRPALAGKPCIIEGFNGKGRFMLSYAHLETPNSPDANRWLAHLVSRFTGEPTPRDFLVPPWPLDSLPVHWLDRTLLKARDAINHIMGLGREHMLLFTRNCWLTGWRSGIPGSNLNHLHSLINQTMNLSPTPDAEHYLEEHRAELDELADRFQQEAETYLLAERLAMTLSKTLPEAVSPKELQARRTALFGHPMEQDGLYARLVDILDTLAWLVIKDAQLTAQDLVPDDSPDNHRPAPADADVC